MSPDILSTGARTVVLRDIRYTNPIADPSETEDSPAVGGNSDAHKVSKEGFDSELALANRGQQDNRYQ